MKNLAISLLILTSVVLEATAQERGFVVKRREAKDHIALIIGNASYPDAPLANPANDAMDVATAFTEMGFVVEKVIDADKETMAQAIARFSQKLPTAKAAVFYYAGHGVQVNGDNYLLPIGKTAATQITEESQVPYRAVNAGEVLSAMEQANVKFAMVVLDACRNNPFKGGGRGKVPGLASIDAPVGSLVMYATKAGSIASDGQGIRNSPFSTAFLKHVKTPGLDVNLLPSKITKTVGELTKGLQVPGTYMQLNESFTFVPAMTPDEEKTLKTSQLTGLKAQDALMVQKEAEMERKKKEDDAALAKKQAEIDALDKQIADLKTKTASGNSSTAETDLDKMLLYVEQKEAQKKQLEVLQKQAEDRRIASEKELYNMKLGQYKAKDTEINTNLEKYYKIAASEFGKDMAQAAWDGVLAKYGIAKGTISRGDEYSLKSQANPEPEPEGVMAGGGSIVVGAVFVKGGTFTMGSSESNDEKPMHTVTLGNFIMMKYEVTFAQYDAFCDATGNTKPSDQGWGRGNRPVINVSWNDATAYAQWLSQKTGKNWRLPTEAEWEYAARGGSAGSASSALYSGSSNIDEVAWYSANSDSQTQPVGQKRPNALGLCDMTGNVWEWCQDWYGSSYYSSSLTNNPQGPSSGTNRVCRGGSCTDNASFCRAANRTCDAPDDRINTLGFRLVSPK